MILAVGDDLALQSKLEAVGEVAFAPPGAMARAAARRVSPDVIVLSRFADLIALRRVSPTALILLVTDEAGPIERIAAFACGAVGYIVRDEVGVLVDAVRAALAIRREASEPSAVASPRRLH